MKKLGYTDPKWSPKTALQLEIEREDLVAWAKRPVAKLTYDYRPAKLQLSETAKHVFAVGIHFIKASVKL